MEYLRCILERIPCWNEQNGYSVLKCRAKGFQDLVAVVGAMPEVHVESVLSLGGTWKLDAKYGRQFSVETCEETLPATVVGIEKYLGSGLVKGIGPKFAQRIVQRFSQDTLDIRGNAGKKEAVPPEMAGQLFDARSRGCIKLRDSAICGLLWKIEQNTTAPSRRLPTQWRNETGSG